MSQKQEKLQFLKIGASCAMITAICYFFIVICAFFSPASVASYVASNEYFKQFEPYKHYFVVLKSMMLIGDASTIGLIISFFKLHKLKNQSIFTCLTVLAVIGLGVGMYQSILDATQLPHLAAEYAKASESVKHVIIAFGIASPAVYILSMALPGLWFLTLAMGLKKELPKFLFYLLLLWGLGNFVTPAAHIFIIIWMIYTIAAVACLVSPFWGIYLCKYFLAKAKKLGK